MPFLRVPEAVDGGNGGRRAPQEGPLDEGHELGGQPKVAAVDPSWPRERNHSPSSVPSKPVLKAPQGDPGFGSNSGERHPALNVRAQDCVPGHRQSALVFRQLSQTRMSPRHEAPDHR